MINSYSRFFFQTEKQYYRYTGDVECLNLQNTNVSWLMHQKITFATKIIRNVKIDDILISAAVPQVPYLGDLLTSQLLHDDSPDVVPRRGILAKCMCNPSGTHEVNPGFL
jgi:hypothetical protein